MKKIWLTIIIAIIYLNPVFSQNNTDQNENQSKQILSIGPYFGFKAGVNGQNVQLGRKNGVSLYPVPDFGVSSFLSLNEDYSLGISLDLGYSTYSYTLIDSRFNDKYNFHFAYLTLNPIFYFIYYGIGFTIGYPLNADFGESIPTENLSFIAEFNISFTYPILFDEDIAMNFFAKAGYFLTGVYKNYKEHDPLKDKIPEVPPDHTSEAFNPRPISLLIGLNYLFTIDN